MAESEEQIEGELPPSKLPKEPVASKVKKVCDKYGHDYQPVEDADHRQVVGNNTFIRRSYLCPRCGDVINPIISVWADWVPHRRK